MQQSDQWSTGMSGRSAGPQPLSLLDILKKNAELEGRTGRAPNLMPYPSETLIELLGNLFIQAADIQKVVLSTKANPVLHNRKAAHKKLDSIIRKVELIKRVIRLIGNDVDEFVVDKPKK